MLKNNQEGIPVIPRFEAHITAKRQTSARKAIPLLGSVIFVVFLSMALSVYALVQLLPPGDAWLAPIIPFKGVYGEDSILPGLQYVTLLEASGLVSFFGLFLNSYYTQSGFYPRSIRVLGGFARPLKIFGSIIASIAYTESHLLWGELWYGIKLFDMNPQGFPWGSERVAANTCFIQGPNYVQTYGAPCTFLNYDELFFISIGAVVAGWLISYYVNREGLRNDGEMKKRFLP